MYRPERLVALAQNILPLLAWWAMYVNPAYEYQLYILKAKTAKTEEDYQKYLSIAIHFLEKMGEGKQPEAASA